MSSHFSQIQIKRGRWEDFAATNQVLSSGEPCYAINSGIFVIGDGQTPFLELHTPTYFDKIKFDTFADASLFRGEMGWDEVEGTLDLAIDNNFLMHIGEHSYYRIRNATGNTLYAGQAAYAAGVHNNRLIDAQPYLADGTIREIRYIGQVVSDIETNQTGYSLSFGHIEKIDTRGNGAVNTNSNLWDASEPDWFEGDILFVHPSDPGKLTKIEPKHSIATAIILNKHQNQGRIFVRPTSYGHLSDNHDVNISNPTNGQILMYNSATERWENVDMPI